MKNGHKRGMSVGTIVMIVVTTLVIGGCVSVFPAILGEQTLRSVDAQRIMSSIISGINLPELALSDIPIFASAVPKTSSTEETSSLHEDSNPQINDAGQSAPLPTLPPPAATEAPTTPPRQAFSLSAAGTYVTRKDIRVSAYNSESETYDFSDLMMHISDELANDISLITLESLIDEANKISDSNTVPEALDAVHAAGFDMVAIGHESAMDFGLSGLSNTLEQIRMKGFFPIGATTDRNTQVSSSIIPVSNVNVAFLHYTEAVKSKGASYIKNENAAFALPVIEIDTIRADIAEARLSGAKAVVVLLHWGKSERSTPSKAQQTLLQQIAEAGADIILGAHGQTTHSVEMLDVIRLDGRQGKTLVAYSLGALLTDSRESPHIASIILHVDMVYDTVADSLVFDSITYTPTYIWRYREDKQNKYRVVASDREPPESMSEEQQAVMERAFVRIEKLMADAVAENIIQRR